MTELRALLHGFFASDNIERFGDETYSIIGETEETNAQALTRLVNAQAVTDSRGGYWIIREVPMDIDSDNLILALGIGLVAYLLFAREPGASLIPPRPQPAPAPRPPAPVSQVDPAAARAAVQGVLSQYGLADGGAGSGALDVSYWAGVAVSSGDIGYVTGRLQADLLGTGPDAGTPNYGIAR